MIFNVWSRYIIESPLTSLEYVLLFILMAIRVKRAVIIYTTLQPIIFMKKLKRKNTKTVNDAKRYISHWATEMNNGKSLNLQTTKIGRNILVIAYEIFLHFIWVRLAQLFGSKLIVCSSFFQGWKYIGNEQQKNI